MVEKDVVVFVAEDTVEGVDGRNELASGFKVVKGTDIRLLFLGGLQIWHAQVKDLHPFPLESFLSVHLLWKK